MRKSPRSQENRSGRFRSITTFRFWPLNKLKILLNKSKKFIKANFLVGPCLRKKMMRNLSFDQNWESWFYYIAPFEAQLLSFCIITWELPNTKKDAPDKYLEGFRGKNGFGSVTTILGHIFILGHLTKCPLEAPNRK